MGTGIKGPCRRHEKERGTRALGSARRLHDVMLDGEHNELEDRLQAVPMHDSAFVELYGTLNSLYRLLVTMLRPSEASRWKR